MAPYPSTLAWKIPWMEEPGRLQSMGFLSVGHDWATSLSLSCTGEGNGNPLQCSCLENPRDREAGGLPSMGSHRVGHDWSDAAAAAAKYFNYHFCAAWDDRWTHVSPKQTLGPHYPRCHYYHWNQELQFYSPNPDLSLTQVKKPQSFF